MSIEISISGNFLYAAAASLAVLGTGGVWLKGKLDEKAQHQIAMSQITQTAQISIAQYEHTQNQPTLRAIYHGVEYIIISPNEIFKKEGGGNYRYNFETTAVDTPDLNGYTDQGTLKVSADNTLETTCAILRSPLTGRSAIATEFKAKYC